MTSTSTVALATAEEGWWRRKLPEQHWGAYEDFRKFLWLVWKHLDLPDPTAIQYDIALYLQHGPRREIIEAFRGVGKSWITSAYVCWLLLRDPQHKIMVVSASKERADQFSTFTLRLISEMPILRHLQPRPGQRSSKIAFDVGPAKADHSPSVKSVGIFGQLTGSRAGTIIADDVEVPNNSETQGMRDKLAERVKEFDAVLKPGGRIIYLGTPQCEDSLYNLMPERGYKVRIWPSRYPSAAAMDAIYGDSLAPKLAMQLVKDPSLSGRPTDPRRFTDVDLMEREASYGRSGFALQFMLDTRLSDADRYPLKLADLIMLSTDGNAAPEKLIWAGTPDTTLPDLHCVGLNGDRFHTAAATRGDYVEFQNSVMFVDPSGRGSDETGYAVVKSINGYLHTTAAGGLQGGYSDSVMITLCEVAKANKVHEIVVESNFGDGMFEQLLRPHVARIYPCTVVEHRVPNRQKELRIIDTLEPVMNQHRLVVDPKIVERDVASTKDYPPEKALKMQLFYQLSRITKDRGALAHDDRLDALAGAVGYLVEMMGRDEDELMEQRDLEQKLAQIRDFNGQQILTIDRLAMGMTMDMARGAASGGRRGTWMRR